MAFFSSIRNALARSSVSPSAFQSQPSLSSFYSTLTAPKLFVSAMKFWSF
ncbi:hypothetical protein BT93_K0082 [Corymbia citriodora subsp. variegata]|nr:hypothetical protein BT93_K0082 [Corymbia citriodora subsp. variegata]